jgi:hypothetical protein
MSSIESTPKTLTDNEIQLIDNENNNNNNNNFITTTTLTSLPSVDDNDCHQNSNRDTNQMSTTSQSNRLSFRSNLNNGKNYDKIQTNEKSKTQIYVMKWSKASFIDSGMALKRSASADSIFIPTSYVSSPQLSLHTYCGRLMMDRASQVSPYTPLFITFYNHFLSNIDSFYISNKTFISCFFSSKFNHFVYQT